MPANPIARVPGAEAQTALNNCAVCSLPMHEFGSAGTVPLTRCDCGFISVDFKRWQYPFADKDYYTLDSLSIPDIVSPSVNHRIRMLGQYVTSGMVCDLGCGTGQTVIGLARAGYQAIGVDESRLALDFLRANFSGAEWCNCGIFDYLSQPRIHDCLTLYHVMEHIPAPRELCSLLSQRLRPGGLLVVEVPDVKSGQARLAGRRWGMYHPGHVNYFTTATLRGLMEPFGFRLVERENRYHFAQPSGIPWKDRLHQALAAAGMHSIVATYWIKA